MRVTLLNSRLPTWQNRSDPVQEVLANLAEVKEQLGNLAEGLREARPTAEGMPRGAVNGVGREATCELPPNSIPLLGPVAIRYEFGPCPASVARTSEDDGAQGVHDDMPIKPPLASQHAGGDSSAPSMEPPITEGAEENAGTPSRKADEDVSAASGEAGEDASAPSKKADEDGGVPGTVAAPERLRPQQHDAARAHLSGLQDTGLGVHGGVAAQVQSAFEDLRRTLLTSLQTLTSIVKTQQRDVQQVARSVDQLSGRMRNRPE